ncbi:MAG: hypothetical protein U5K54_22945 [Cytophagales bacterium]|nr:hypothetical protein [Cytophagales bacterium]
MGTLFTMYGLLNAFDAIEGLLEEGYPITDDYREALKIALLTIIYGLDVFVQSPCLLTSFLN